MLTGAYEIKTTTVKKIAPWLYGPFRKMVGEHPSSRSAMLAKQDDSTATSGVAGIVGINPEELSVTIENLEDPLDPAVPSEKTSIIPVSQPLEKPEPVDENIPVG